MKKGLFAFVAFAFMLQFTAAQAKEVEVLATGSADTEEWALNRALDNAVKQSSKVRITRNTPMINAKAVSNSDLKYDFDYDENPLDDDVVKKKGKRKCKDKDKGKAETDKPKNSYEGNKNLSANRKTEFQPDIIEAEYDGTILSYTVEKTEFKDGKYYVTVKAKVEVAGDYQPKANLKKSEVKIAVAPFSVNKADMECATGTTPEDVSKLLVKDIITALSNTGKVQVVERYDFTGYLAEAGLVAAGASSKDNEKYMNNLATADYILTGSVDEVTVTVKEDGIAIMNNHSDRTVVKMKVSFRLIETATMEVVYASEASEGAIKKGGSMSCDKALANMMEVVPQIVAGKVVMKLYPDYKAEVISRRDFKDKYFADGVDEDNDYEDARYREYLDKTENGFSYTSTSSAVYRKAVDTKQDSSEQERPAVKLPMDK